MTQDSQPNASLPVEVSVDVIDDSALQALGLGREDLPKIAEIGRDPNLGKTRCCRPDAGNAG